MKRLLILLAMAGLLSGCCHRIVAPGAQGMLIDELSRKPVGGALVTRLAIPGGLDGNPFVPPEGLPAVTVTSEMNGSFNLAPPPDTDLVFCISNPRQLEGNFLVTAAGYDPVKLHGFATSRYYWRVDFGQVPLKRLKK